MYAIWDHEKRFGPLGRIISEGVVVKDGESLHVGVFKERSEMLVGVQEGVVPHDKACDLHNKKKWHK